MQPLQSDSRLSDAKHNSITLAAAAARNVDAAIPLRSANTELPSAIELRTTAPPIAAILQLQNRISTPKRKNNDFEALFFLKGFFLRKIIHAKMKKSAAKAPFATCNNLHANLYIQIASIIHESEAFVGGFLQIPLVEEMKTKLSCEVSFKIQEVKK